METYRRMSAYEQTLRGREGSSVVSPTQTGEVFSRRESGQPSVQLKRLLAGKLHEHCREKFSFFMK